MTAGRPNLSTAVSLMRMALALLDKAGESNAALHLQHAIDVATGMPVPCTVEEVEMWLRDEEAGRLFYRDTKRH